ncbi:META domain-containing protein [uncultured Winogradskyella sp.]|uniref:META domain-containing protein n=1 Tax=uncultured Winogradskyella sp. TaxID=395353 RepID=UPI0026344CBF|nr:META domain-containing protein [uncultured Winogradskyella sp.]
MKFLLSLFTLIVVSQSCNSTKDSIENTNIVDMNKEQITLSGDYTISQIGENKAVSPKLKLSFDEKSNKITGFAGCNNFFGTYSFENGELKFSDIARSKKLCCSEINDIENQFLEVLNTVNNFTLKNDVLSLLDNKNVLLKGTKANAIENKKDARGNYGIGVIYQISSRGVFEYINISESTISFSTDRGLKSVKNYSNNEKDWTIINNLIEAIDIDTFRELEAPSNNRTTDAAAEATLTVKMGDVLHITPAFDHGNPPEEIKALVNKVLSIKENTVKQ